MLYSHFPYVMKKLSSERWAILNRQYQQLGNVGVTFQAIDYFDLQIQLKGLGPATRTKLDYNSSPYGDIYLYNDSCLPTTSRTFMNEYFEKLRIFSRLTIKR